MKLVSPAPAGRNTREFSRPGQLDFIHERTVNLFIILGGHFSPRSLPLEDPTTRVALQRDRESGVHGRVGTGRGKRCMSVMKDEEQRREEGERERERSARAAMRRWLRHHSGGVRRISCESGNTSQLTAGRTAGRAWRGGEG